MNADGVRFFWSDRSDLSDGQKAAAILEAEGRMEAAKRDAQAKVLLAEGTQRAIEMITGAVGANDLPVMYLLGEKYVEALREMAASANAKLVMLPGDLPAAVGAILAPPGK